MKSRIIIDFDRELNISKKELKRLIQKIFADFGRNDFNLVISIVDDAKMAELNQRFRGILGTTDVLSFALEREPFEGEIYISLPQAIESTKNEKVTVEKEIFKLVIHGLLHLLGVNHENDSERKKNEEMMERYLKLLATTNISTH
jgi:probable rRNA maturation factor